MTESSQARLSTPSAAEVARLNGLAAFLRRARSAVRFVDYRRAESDCERLAARLAATYSAEELRSLRFVGIPRGGQIVLGMLSYWLDLAPEQIWPEAGGDGPLVLVDDCALTGARLHQALRRPGGRPVAVALLYAHPDLCRAAVEQTPGLDHCLTAHELVDQAPRLFPEPGERRRWRAAWEERLGDEERFWLGLPELVAFAWSEPDRLLWNPVTERVENGWRFVPPDRCLEHRGELGPSPAPERPRRWRPDGTLVTGRFDRGLLLYLGRTDQVFRLDEMAAEMWRALVAWGEPATVVEHLRDRFDVDPATLRRDLQRFVEALAASGLLQRTDA